MPVATRLDSPNAVVYVPSARLLVYWVVVDECRHGAEIEEKSWSDESVSTDARDEASHGLPSRLAAFVPVLLVTQKNSIAPKHRNRGGYRRRPLERWPHAQSKVALHRGLGTRDAHTAEQLHGRSVVFTNSPLRKDHVSVRIIGV